MSKVKKQHYVPQFYLKKFTHNGEHLFVFDKINKKQRTANVKDVAHENYFYDIPLNTIPENIDKGSLDTQTFEKALSRIEGNYSQSIKQVLESLKPKKGFKRLISFLKFRGNKIITKKQKRDFSFFITIQFLRTKESRDGISELTKKMTEEIFNAFSEVNIPEDEVEQLTAEINESVLTLFHLQTLFDPEFISNITESLNNHIWILGINKSNQPLYTSDHPVVKNGGIKSQFRSFEGLASKGIEIAIPLTPGHIMLIYEKTFYKDLIKLDRKCTFLDEDNITYLNSLQVQQSYRQIFCISNNFDLAENMCKENPNLSLIPKNRIKIQ